MIQIISDKHSDWVDWLGRVIERLEHCPPVSRLVVVAETEEGENGNLQVIEFMNCSTDDVYYLGGLLQKEAIKHEMIEELGIDDDYWEFDENEVGNEGDLDE